MIEMAVIPEVWQSSRMFWSGIDGFRSALLTLGTSASLDPGKTFGGYAAAPESVLGGNRLQRAEGRSPISHAASAARCVGASASGRYMAGSRELYFNNVGPAHDHHDVHTLLRVAQAACRSHKVCGNTDNADCPCLQVGVLRGTAGCFYLVLKRKSERS